jgi:hypothetical protein
MYILNICEALFPKSKIVVQENNEEAKIQTIEK